MNVIDKVVKKGLCCGCGVCAGVCPAGCLEMRMDMGRYRPVLAGKCLARCDVCLSICPFYDHDLLRDDIAKGLFGKERGANYDRSAGYYLHAFIGHSLLANQRERGASGGMATWLLERLLTSGEVDRVMAVGSVQSPGRPLFQYETYTDSGQVRGAAGSKYYPVEISAALRAAWRDSEDQHYAIVGLPCVLQGIRRAALKYPRLARRIHFLLGLVCNHCPGSYYTEFLCTLAGVSSSGVQTVDYRLKGIQRANDYRFRALTGDDSWSRSVGFQGLPSRIWNKQYFAYEACSYCDDVFAEMGDAVFMDAWLEEFLPETRGTSIVVVRNAQLKNLLEEGIREGLCDLTSCSIEDVVTSQISLVHHKKETIPYRMLVRLQEGDWLPKMQVQAAEKIGQAELRSARQEARVIRLSNKLWPLFRRMPVRFLPVYCWMVDQISGDNDTSTTIALKAVLVRILKTFSLYEVVTSLKWRSLSWRRKLSNQTEHCLARLTFGYARVLGWIRMARRADPTNGSALILPPASPGSLGDEAVEMALVTALMERGIERIGIVSYSKEDKWDHLMPVDKVVDMQGFFQFQAWKDLFRFARMAIKYQFFYALGTDVLDGAYSDSVTSPRLALVSLAASTGVKTSIVSFSFNNNPTPTAVGALRDLPPNVRLCTRDPISQERLARHLARSVELTADIAFLLKPVRDSAVVVPVLKWVREQRDAGRTVVGINANRQSVTLVPGLRLEDLIDAHNRTLAELFNLEKVSFLLIPHDFRGDLNDIVLAKTIFKDMSVQMQAHSMIIPTPCTAAEIKGICAEPDIVLSGRMHCAIACLGQGTPVACITYQDKFEGLFKHFGLDGMTIEPEQVLQPGKLQEFFVPLFRNCGAIRDHIRRELPRIQSMAWRNIV